MVQNRQVRCFNSVVTESNRPLRAVPDCRVLHLNLIGKENVLLAGYPPVLPFYRNLKTAFKPFIRLKLRFQQILIYTVTWFLFQQIVKNDDPVLLVVRLVSCHIWHRSASCQMLVGNQCMFVKVLEPYFRVHLSSHGVRVAVFPRVLLMPGRPFMFT